MESKLIDWRSTMRREGQLIRAVWGLGRDPNPCTDVTVVLDDPVLMDMDAPEVIPAGSTERQEHRFADGSCAWWVKATSSYREVWA